MKKYYFVYELSRVFQNLNLTVYVIVNYMPSILDFLTVSFEANDLFISYGSEKCEKLAMLPQIWLK